jgi:twitching motility protein PilT
VTSSLIHEINVSRPVHIVTLEDPIEYVHGHQIGTINQRELGIPSRSARF